MRINKYLAHKQYCTRREADSYIKAGKVLINGRIALLGDMVTETDTVDVLFTTQQYQYFAYNKPRGETTPENEDGLFPIGRLDKDSRGLLILTNDGRITDRLLNPTYAHEKEYLVEVQETLRRNFESAMSSGVSIGDYTTRRATVTVTDSHHFTIVLTEGKKHQIRRMCETLGYTVVDLVRTRIMNVALDRLKAGMRRKIEGAELEALLTSIGL